MDEARVSSCDILTYHRELLVSRLRSIQCILDNLSACGFLCEEDVEIVQRTVTKTDQRSRSLLWESSLTVVNSNPNQL